MATHELPKLNYKDVESQICNFIRHKTNGKGVVVGLSGGVDSAVAASLSVRAIGKDKVLALIMPDANSTPEVDTEDAIAFANKLAIRHEKIDITETTRSLIGSVGRRGGNVAEGNLKARLRMIVLYYWANIEDRIVVGSGDKSELCVGYFTKYGDGGVDILPIGYLYKTQVKELGTHLGVPQSITRKKSSPRLWPDQIAEDELGLSYVELDRVLHLHVDLGYKKEEILRELGQDASTKVNRVISLIKKNSHKLKTPPIAKISQ